ncbi:hypothetical protein C8F04DRAFT_1289414 [Mycena alexandri]|uniref:Uncharacterized protein n=1 Tax=Mycena alexandri TaxID=1745969 RepID=A0AAD6SK15_9AGAR|nr:hypothetical protein C8F04DRAFT_1289414 [Mycena alexandri]
MNQYYISLFFPSAHRPLRMSGLPDVLKIPDGPEKLSIPAGDLPVSALIKLELPPQRTSSIFTRPTKRRSLKAVHQLRRVVDTTSTEATALPAALRRLHHLSPPPSSPPTPSPAPLPSRTQSGRVFVEFYQATTFSILTPFAAAVCAESDNQQDMEPEDSEPQGWPLVDANRRLFAMLAEAPLTAHPHWLHVDPVDGMLVLICVHQLPLSQSQPLVDANGHIFAPTPLPSPTDSITETDLEPLVDANGRLFAMLAEDPLTAHPHWLHVDPVDGIQSRPLVNANRHIFAGSPVDIIPPPTPLLSPTHSTCLLCRQRLHG